MEYVKLGQTDLEASRLGLGCAQIASISTRTAPAEIRGMLLEAFDAGVNFFDTADIYGQGDSERLLGRLFGSQRDRVIFCTKAGLTLGVSQPLVRHIKPFANIIVRHWKKGRRHALHARKEAEAQCFDPVYLRRRIEGSLKRLKTDYLDLLLLHSPPKDIIHEQAVFDLLDSLVKQGLIRYFGISCNSPDDIAWFTQRQPACLQVPVSVVHPTSNRIPIGDAVSSVGMILREPLAGGAALAHPPVTRVAASCPDRSASQIAIQYLLQRYPGTVILGGVSSRAHLRDNLGAFAAAPLSRKNLAILDG